MSESDQKAIAELAEWAAKCKNEARAEMEAVNELQIAQLIEQRDALLAACKGLTENPYVDLGGLVYQVREREGEGWEGQYVKEWSDAVQAAAAAIALAEGKEAV